jgi:hypothetical protein
MRTGGRGVCVIGLLCAWGCGDSGIGDAGDGGAEADVEAGTDGDADADADAEASVPRCDDGVRNGDEDGIDCGGSCPNPDCCANGHTDASRGEWAPDCGGACPACYTGTVYYVAADGDDANDGLAGTPDHAWRTIGRANAQELHAGDAVLFRSGDEWREQLVIDWSGTSEAYVTFAAYGEGPKPRILGSNRAADWTAVDGHPNVWRSATTLAAPREREGHAVSNHPSSIFFGGPGGGVTWGNMEALHLNAEGAPMDIYTCDETGTPFALLDREYDWCWQDEHVYVYAPTNPGERYAFVEVPQRVSAIRTAGHPPEEYVAIDGLELLFALKYGYDDGWPMNVVVRGLTVRNCHIGWIGTKGAASAIGLQIWHSDMLVERNEIHDCGRRNISYNVYGDVRDAPLVFENVVFDGNELHGGYHTTGFDVSCGYTDTFRNFVFRNNFIWDDPADDPADHPNDFTSMGIYLSAGDATFTGFLVHHNILKHTKQKGITINGLRDSQVLNNTLYGMNERAGGDYRGMITVSGDVADLRIHNNVFYGQVDPATGLVLSCVTFTGGAEAGAVLDYNLYYQLFDTQRIVTTGSSWRMGDWEDYRGATGWDTHSPAPADPQFADPLADDFHLLPGSPAIDRGLVVPGITDGYLGSAPDLGAVESAAE